MSYERKYEFTDYAKCKHMFMVEGYKISTSKQKWVHPSGHYTYGDYEYANGLPLTPYLTASIIACLLRLKGVVKTKGFNTIYEYRGY